MLYSLLSRLALPLIFAYAFFLSGSIAWADGFQITPANYTNFLATQEGSFSQKGDHIALKSKAQSIVIVKTTDIHGTIDIVQFSDFSSHAPSLVLLWKLRGQEYAPANQMPIAINNGVIKLPQPLNLDNFDFIGFVFFDSSLTFSSIELREENFSDKMTTFLQPELVKPSSINLLYGAKFGSTPFVEILGILSLLVFLVLIFINKKWAFLSLLGFWMLFDLRYSYDQYAILTKTYHNFVVPATPQERVYYDFGNLYGFIEESKKYIQGDINFYAPSDWPFQYNYSYQMYPLHATWQTTDKPYYALFQINGVEIKNGKELYIDGKLIDQNVKIISQFDAHSYILKKN